MVSKIIAWYGIGRRELLGYTWGFSGQQVTVEDEEVALDILTQPGENFREVMPPPVEVSPAGDKVELKLKLKPKGE
jgi:hypothetical protein